MFHGWTRPLFLKQTSSGCKKLYIDDDIFEGICSYAHVSAGENIHPRINANTDLDIDLNSDEDIYENVDNSKSETSKLKSDQNYISRFVYRHLGDNYGLLSSDLTVNIVNKTYESIKSYYSAKESGLKSNLPKYLPKNALFILPFYGKKNMG